MCIIVIKNKGVEMPSKTILKNCFENNPDGAGIMFAKNGKVNISKGFMDWEGFENYIDNCNFSKNDSVVMHFRIGTQGPNFAEFTHPYPRTHYIEHCKKLDVICNLGIVHNGVIKMTSDNNSNYNDTMLFITKYLTKLIKGPQDLNDEIFEIISLLTNSKWALMEGDGKIHLIGQFNEFNGIHYSNFSWLARKNYKI